MEHYNIKTERKFDEKHRIKWDDISVRILSKTTIICQAFALTTIICQAFALATIICQVFALTTIIGQVFSLTTIILQVFAQATNIRLYLYFLWSSVNN